MSTTLNGRQTVVPRRRAEAVTPTSDSLADESPSHQQLNDESQVNESSSPPPILLRLPDLSLLGKLHEPAMVSEAPEQYETASSPDPSGDRREKEPIDSPRYIAASSPGLDFGEFWQTGKGKLIVSGTLIVVAMLLFAMLGPTQKPDSDGDKGFVNSPDDQQNLVEPVEPDSLHADHSEPKPLESGARGLTASGTDESPNWDPSRQVAPRQPTRVADQRGNRGSPPIPTFRIPKTYAAPTDRSLMTNHHRSAGPANHDSLNGPDLNGQGRRPLSLNHQQSQRPAPNAIR